MSKKKKDITIKPPDLALLSTLIGSNYPCLELIFIVPKVFEPLMFNCIFLFYHFFLYKFLAIHQLLMYANGGYSFLTYETEFVLFLAVLENSVLPMD